MFGHLAVEGERLRRVLVLEDTDSFEAWAAIAQYRKEIAEGKPWNFSELKDALLDSLADLAQEAAQPIQFRCVETLEDCLWNVDAVLCIAAASCFACGIIKSEMQVLASIAEAWTFAHSSAYPCLWNLADELEMQLGPDPDALGCYYRWTDELAYCSLERLKVGEALASLGKA